MLSHCKAQLIAWDWLRELTKYKQSFPPVYNKQQKTSNSEFCLLYTKSYSYHCLLEDSEDSEGEYEEISKERK